MFALWPPHQIKHQIDYNNCGLLCFKQHSKKTQGNSYSLLSWMMTITLMMTSLILICCHPFLFIRILIGLEKLGIFYLTAFVLPATLIFLNVR